MIDTATLQSIELDFAYDEDDLAEALVRALADIDVTYKIVNLNGPGGGWPVIKFLGTREALVALLLGPYGLNVSELSDYLTD